MIASVVRMAVLIEELPRKIDHEDSEEMHNTNDQQVAFKPNFDNDRESLKPQSLKKLLKKL